MIDVAPLIYGALGVAAWETGRWLLRLVRARRSPAIEWRCVHCATLLRVSLISGGDRDALREALDRVALTHLDEFHTQGGGGS